MSFVISHRSNLVGSFPELENHPEQIKKVIFDLQIDCEIDVRLIKGQFYLGHDYAKYKVTEYFLMNEKLWLHCKDLESLLILRDIHPKVFSHENDKYALTNYGTVITCDWNNCKNCILVCANPKFKELPKNIDGIITDYPLYYSKIYEKI